MRIIWQMEGGRVRTISYLARFVRAAGGDAWLYAGEKWHSTDGDLVLVLHGRDQAEVARTAARVLPEVRERIIPEMGLEDDEDLRSTVQQIKIYTSMAHLQFSIYPSYTDPLAGWNEPGESIKILASREMSRRAMRVLLGHEYGHVASFQYGPHATHMPWWILEGIAELVAEPWAGNGERTDRMIRAWATSGNLREWPQLADFRGEAINHSTHVYRQGHQMMRYITGRFGKDERNTWMIEMARGASLDEATRKVFGMPFDQLDAEWRVSIGQNAGPDSAPAADPAEPVEAGAP
jgi:hypothetical protein